MEETVHAVVFKDSDSKQWVALCLEYGVTTQGDSEEHAKSMLREAIQLHLEDAGREEREVLQQSTEGEPRVHRMSINAPALLYP